MMFATYAHIEAAASDSDVLKLPLADGPSENNQEAR
jgi:hypothetical protein